MKRFGTMLEITSLATYLATDQAHYVNGQAIEIDGGLMMS